MDEKKPKEIIREELKKLSELSWGQRLGYIWDYYKPLMAAILVVIFLVCMGVTMYRNSQIEHLLNVYLINSNYLEIDTDAMTSEFADRIGGLKAKQEILIDPTLQLSAESQSQYDVANQVKSAALLSIGDMDVVLMDEEVFENYQKQGYLMNLEEILTEEQIETWKELQVYREVPSEEETDLPAELDFGTEADRAVQLENETEADQAVQLENETETDQAAAESETELDPDAEIMLAALDVTTSQVLKKYGAYSDTKVYAGVIINASHPELCDDFLEYLLQE